MRAKIAEDDERHSYRAYIAETLRLQGEGKYLQKRWLDIVGEQQPAAPERSGDEIALDVIRRAGLKIRPKAR